MRIGSGSKDPSRRNQTIVMFVPAGPLTPAFPEGVAGAGVGGPRRGRRVGIWAPVSRVTD